MKKRYQKPEVYFEDFELSTNIATACGTKAPGPTNGTCGVNVDGIGKVFLMAMTDCTYKGADGDYSICYHNPSDLKALFNS